MYVSRLREGVNSMTAEIRKDGRTVWWTEHESCLPSMEKRKSLKAAGYKIYKDGKLWREEKGK